ncbi:transcription initiation factor IIB [Candidatus Hecatella orcuttiae]|jgi:transcription initiation factor TFIIB|uniref:transcription initiation factor IIB n=1 Tax=Candidatus Hecatella orcuttiae TaxID=1935119 RepID=UPI0031834ED2
MSDYDQGELVCMSCGYVLDDKIADTGPEWRAFDDEQKAKRTRVGAPLTYTIHDKGLSTLIDWHNKDTSGRDLSPVQMSQVFTLRKWQRRTRVADASERNLAFALSEMSKISSSLNLPKSILETAAVFYRKAVRRRLIRGRSIQGVAAATIYMSCRKCNIPRTLDEIAQATPVGKKEIGRCYRFLAKELDEFIPPIFPSKYVSKISNQLSIMGKAELVAATILEIASSLRLTSGRGPTGVAAAAAYIASVLAGNRKTQREVALVANVTEVTIRNRYKELMDRIQIKVKL